jgi:predicted aspartyl protease
MRIQGQIDETLQIRLPLRVRGLHGVVEIEAIVDTGFNGMVFLPATVALPLGLVLSDIALVELAEGGAHPRMIFSGWAQIGESPEVPAAVMVAFADDALIGMALLNSLNARMDLDLPQRVVTLNLPEGQQHFS